MTKTDSRRYYPTALALYITYFVLGIAATIMGQYKQDFAALWGASKLADGSFDVSSVVPSSPPSAWAVWWPSPSQVPCPTVSAAACPL